VTKIAVTGTHSTGKTTFVNAVRDDLQGRGYRVAVVSDLGEEALNRGFPILCHHTPESTLWIMTTGIARELEAALTADVVLVDRPVPDALGYYRAALAYRDEAAPEPVAAYLLAVAEHHSRTYDLILSTELDPAIPLGTNKPRDPDGRFRVLAAHSIANVLHDLGIAGQPLTAGNQPTAVATTVAFVADCMKPTQRRRPSGVTDATAGPGRAGLDV
jgi:hypothetical protein